MSKDEDSSRATCGSLSDGDLSDSCCVKENDAKGAEPVGDAQKQKAKKKQRQRQRQEKDEAFRNMLAKQGTVGGNGAVETPGAEDMVGVGGQETESTNHHKKLSKNEILQQEKQRKERNRALQEERDRKKQEEEAARLKAVPAAKDSCNRIEKSNQDVRELWLSHPIMTLACFREGPDKIILAKVNKCMKMQPQGAMVRRMPTRLSDLPSSVFLVIFIQVINAGITFSSVLKGRMMFSTCNNLSEAQC